ncbi:MAG: bifunctional glutamate N-acetyltransferase/amino-acid acetyltransferase ArgJ [Spirochaetia bacterium]|nr:bifunctional glutamate N-acetyltransferase/amino-acid acetyltransferase ArgJ [Spirochaetia bacterium]
MKKPSIIEHCPEGFYSYHTSCGIKDESLDLGVIYSENPSTASALFTQNAFVGEPIKIGRNIIKNGSLQAIVVNSKNSNVATGLQGHENSLKICKKIASEMKINEDLVLPSSTGVIGRPLPVEKIINGLNNLKTKLVKPADFIGFATAIMTTDTFPKFVSAKLGNASIVGVAKGSGMIEPNMATMLAYFFTDAQINAHALHRILRACASKSFNCLSVDSDTSTSDTLAIMANGLAGEVNVVEFENTLEMLCTDLTKMIARDGEGATKLFTVDVINADIFDSARKIGKSIINSPLVKTMIYKGDPNWGRIYMAVGKTKNVHLDEPNMKIQWGKDRLLDSNSPISELHKYLTENEEIHLTVDLGTGTESCRVYGCDLTEEYVRINAYYTT